MASMKTVTVGRVTSPTQKLPLKETLGPTSRLIAAGLLFVALGTVGIYGQTSAEAIQRDFDNGQFGRVVEKAVAAPSSPASRLLSIRSLIHLERYDEADRMLTTEISSADGNKNASKEYIADLYISHSLLSRVRQDFPTALKHANTARLAAPASRRIEIEYHYSIGRVLYSSGFDIAAIVWLEKAEKLSSTPLYRAMRLDIYRHLSLAWSSKFNYAKAVEYAERLIDESGKTRYTYKHRTGLYDLANILNACGEKRRAKGLLEKALALSTAGGDDYQGRVFLSTLLTNALYDGDVGAASRHLAHLEKIDTEKRFAIETTLGKAVIAAFTGNKVEANRYFDELEKLPVYSQHFIPYWKTTVAEKNGDWAGLLEQSKILQSLSERQNFRDDLPAIYLNIAKAHLGLGDPEKSREAAMRSVGFVNESQPSGNAPLSLALSETYHAVYRLLADLSQDEPVRSFEVADHLKGRVLRDLIENSALRRKPDVSIEVRQRADELSTRWVSSFDMREQLAEFERSVTLSSNRREIGLKPDSDSIETKDLPAGTVIVSYFFALDGGLRAYVLERGKAVRVVKLPFSENDADSLAKTIRIKILDGVFFKSDGKEIYNKLLAPLFIDSEHIVIVPDKSLWKIPFHALSADGESYLIEQKTVSYSASVSLLLNELKKPAPIRRSIRVFANDSFRDLYLAHVNREAAKVARMFSSSPVTGATRTQFLKFVGESDIVHFSMHAEADSEAPLKSFLAFRAQGPDSGRITVEDLLSVQMKKRSLTFLASCETNNVLNGEGLVSIAWALLGSGSTSVISAQWEANDRSSEIFTEEFYKHYRKGGSAAKALQTASIAMIRNKSTASHEPYFWASFVLLGDYR
jgi:CHAT domain-containing protein